MKIKTKLFPQHFCPHYQSLFLGNFTYCDFPTENHSSPIPLKLVLLHKRIFLQHGDTILRNQNPPVHSNVKQTDLKTQLYIDEGTNTYLFQLFLFLFFYLYFHLYV